MNAADVLRYGHLTVHRSIDSLPEPAWTTRDVCGWWSCKDIMAHLASFELVLAEVLASFTDDAPSPTLARMLRNHQAFNDEEVPARAAMTPRQIVAEYDAHHLRTMELVTSIDADLLRRPGVIPWYGDEYALDDYIVYQYYGHKREHMAQIDHFKDSLAP